jgi:hypothetical protein
VELADKPFIVTEVRQPLYWCQKCQCTHTAELPTDRPRKALFE